MAGQDPSPRTEDLLPFKEDDAPYCRDHSLAGGRILRGMRSLGPTAVSFQHQPVLGLGSVRRGGCWSYRPLDHFCRRASPRCKRGLDVLDHGFKPCDGRFATLLTKLVSLYARAPALQ